MEELLEQFGNISALKEQYENELESIRAQIESQIVANFLSGRYENDQWTVALVPESERRTVIVENLEQAVSAAGLDPEQEALILQTITTSDSQQHVRIRAKNAE
jgi:hypothetical protein